MLRSHTEEQADNVSLPVTAPVLILEWAHSGTPELLSASGLVEFDSRLYTPAPIRIDRITNGRSAQITLTATPQRVSEVHNKTWRGGECKIYSIPAVAGASRVYTLQQALLVIHGEIVKSSWGGGSTITVEVAQSAFGANLTPRDRLDSFGNHMPRPGTAFAVAGDEVILVVRK
jgi:hypothetical protein